LLFFFYLLFFIDFIFCKPNEEVKEFNVRPGVDDTVSVTLKGVTCSFSYSCNGGSSELWQASLSVKDNGEFECYVGRPNPPSYLVFSTFNSKITGGKVQKAELLSGTGHPLTEGKHFKVQKNEVTKGESFDGYLGLLSLSGQKISKGEEL